MAKSTPTEWPACDSVTPVRYVLPRQIPFESRRYRREDDIRIPHIVSPTVLTAPRGEQNSYFSACLCAQNGFLFVFKIETDSHKAPSRSVNTVGDTLFSSILPEELYYLLYRSSDRLPALQHSRQSRIPDSPPPAEQNPASGFTRPRPFYHPKSPPYR